jgi:hypothetical protein
MSEIQRNVFPQNRIQTGSIRSSDWRSLRFMVHRNHTPLLTVGLVETSGYGIERLDARWAGFQILWHPEEAEGDIRLHALTSALRGLSQT